MKEKYNENVIHFPRKTTPIRKLVVQELAPGHRRGLGGRRPQRQYRHPADGWTRRPRHGTVVCGVQHQQHSGARAHSGSGPHM